MTGRHRGSARDLRDDRGTVLLLAVGLVVVAALAVAVVSVVASTFLQRRALAATADLAALAGAQVVDLAPYYAGGATAGLPLDCGRVRAAVLAHLRAGGAPTAVPGLAVESVGCDGTTVTVALRAPLRPPFPGLVPGGGVVRAAASARLSYRAAP